ncbi:glycosyltransferase [Breoghania sp.]|uniref:glycosyltransferase family protein n=1 Tax=Breoghania sp. TaxID=2065378 RepID=UPI002AA77A46|nr:glycosyltransferase [Breoghania sp.]
MLIKKPKILIYSHDSFGLGHLRRCRAIAHSLVADIGDLSALILSGSPIIGNFDFRARVDFVRIPGVIKLRNGEYTSLSLHIDTEQTLAIRASIIEHTAKVYAPDIFLVDKEPTGLRGEVLPTLETLKAAGTRLVLGLRDVMDDPETLREEWERKNVLPALEHLYDEIWIYGQSSIHDPLDGLDIPQSVLDKILYTGYLRRDLPRAQRPMEPFAFSEDPFILVTPGGGGDGEEMVDWVLRAYEARRKALLPALIVLGPFMAPEAQAQFRARAEALHDIHVMDFTPQIEPYLARAAAVVGMGGYNTFCEVLSFDKPTLLIPRIEPRREQAIRANRASENGLADVLPIDFYPDIDLMSDALARLTQAQPPSAARLDGLLGGLDVIRNRVCEILDAEGISQQALKAHG